ncbi:MAG: cation:dicarboxylate symporter family transporter, partial [Phycisphaerae bacterium]
MSPVLAATPEANPMRFSRSLNALILIGLVAGVVVGHLIHDPDFQLTMPDEAHAHATALSLFHFLGNTIFLGLLKMVIIPLITTSVIVGVTSV